MNDKFIVCSNCGFKCDTKDTYCKACSHTLLHSDCLDNPIIDGIDNAELKNHIGKNSEFYIKKFAKKKGKWFIQLNFAALFFGPTWFFYRKMYKVAMIYAAILILLTAILTISLPAVFKSDVDRYYTARETYSNYIDSGGKVYIDNTGFVKKHPTYQRLRDNLVSAQKKVQLIEFLNSAPVFVINILIRLFGNSIYKNHITRNIHSNSNGVSMKSAIGGLVLVNLVILIVSLLLNQISVVAHFYEATQTFYRIGYNL